MRWWVRRTIYLVLLGAVALTLGILASLTARELAVRLLAIGLVLGALAMIIVAIPIGRDDEDRKGPP